MERFNERQNFGIATGGRLVYIAASVKPLCGIVAAREKYKKRCTQNCNIDPCNFGGVTPIVTRNLKYNFATGTWSNDHGEKFSNGVRVE
tara:strand:+ start:281 stop:547 length:267 start_codon:yes stop_codon:yes gene_type:complete